MTTMSDAPNYTMHPPVRTGSEVHAERSRIRFLVELLSILSATSFLLSVVAQQLIFMIWKVDFTAIASVEDVIMGGIRLLVLIVLTGFLLVPLVLSINHFSS